MVDHEHGDAAGNPSREPRRVRLPGFITEDDVGLGDVIKRATRSVGIRPCGGCEKRAQALNRRFVFSHRPQSPGRRG